MLDIVAQRGLPQDAADKCDEQQGERRDPVKLIRSAGLNDAKHQRNAADVGDEHGIAVEGGGNQGREKPAKGAVSWICDAPPRCRSPRRPAGAKRREENHRRPDLCRQFAGDGSSAFPPQRGHGEASERFGAAAAPGEEMPSSE